jgi:hypothetical protein
MLNLSFHRFLEAGKKFDQGKKTPYYMLVSKTGSGGSEI